MDTCIRISETLMKATADQRLSTKYGSLWNLLRVIILQISILDLAGNESPASYPKKRFPLCPCTVFRYDVFPTFTQLNAAAVATSRSSSSCESCILWLWRFLIFPMAVMMLDGCCSVLNISFTAEPVYVLYGFSKSKLLTCLAFNEHLFINYHNSFLFLLQFTELVSFFVF